MTPVHLALYKPHRWYDIGGRLICWWTDSPYSHCELVVGGLAHSSSIRDGGVRAKAIWFDEHWDVFDVPGAAASDVLMLHAQTEGEPYGWLDLVLRQFMGKRGNSTGWFCSEWCAAALGLPEPTRYSPGDLAEYAKGLK